MSDERIVVELTLEDGKYTSRIKGASRDTRAFKGEVKGLDSAVKRTSKSIRGGIVPAMRDWSVIIGQSRNVLHQLWYVTGAWATSLVKTNAEVERLTQLMKGMSTASTAAGRIKEATDNVDALFDAAKTAPFSMNALSDSFVKFKSVGLDPLDGSMQSLTDAVAAFGGTDETLHRASIAIQQMAGKGVISMEELRQQLGEAVPQAITIMARTMGVSYGDLVDQISKGTVAAEPALQAMFRGFNLAFGGRAQAMMKTFNGRVALLKTSWTELVTRTPGMKSFFEAVKDSVSELTKLLNSSVGRNLADNIGNALARAVRSFNELISNVAVGYGKVKSFFDLLYMKSQTQGTMLWAVKELLQNIIDLGLEAGDLMRKLALGDGGEDDLLRQRMISGHDLGEEEFKEALRVYDEDTEKLRLLKKRRDAILSESAFNDVQSMAGFALSSDAEEARNAEKQQTTRIAKIDEHKVNLRRELSSISEIYNHAATERRAAIEEEMRVVDEVRAQEVAKLNAYREDLANAQRAIVALNQISTAQKGPEQYDAFGDTVSKAEIVKQALNELKATAPTVAGAVGRAFENFQNITSEIEEAESKLNDMAETMSREIGEQADALLEPWTDKISEMKDDFLSENQEVMEQLDEITADSTKSRAEKEQEVAEIMAALIEGQINQVQALGEAGSAALQQEGQTGMEAAAVFAANILRWIAAIKSTAGDITDSYKTGIVNVSGKGKGGGGGGKSAGERAAEKLKDMIEEANEEAEELGKRLSDPFAYELPSAIDKAEKKIDKLADKLSGGKWTQQMKNLFDTMATNAVTEELIEMAEATRDIQRELMGERAERKEVYDEEVDRIKKMKAKLIEMGLWRVEWEATIQDKLLALKKQYQSQSPMGEFLSEWKNLYDDMEQVAADTLGNVSQELADMVTEGKANFADLARSAINSLLQISINAALSGLGDILSDTVGGWFGGKTAQAAGRTVDVSALTSQNRYIATPSFAKILDQKESSLTPNQAGNFSGSSSAKVNIINNTGTEVESEETNVRMSPEGLVMDIVLKKVQQPGPFRDSMKRALK